MQSASAQLAQLINKETADYPSIRVEAIVTENSKDLVSSNTHQGALIIAINGREFDRHYKAIEYTGDHIIKKVKSVIIGYINLPSHQQPYLSNSEKFPIQELLLIMGHPLNIRDKMSIDASKVLQKALKRKGREGIINQPIDFIDILFCFFSKDFIILEKEYQQLYNEAFLSVGHKIENRDPKRQDLTACNGKQYTHATMHMFQHAFETYNKKEQHCPYARDFLIACLYVFKKIYNRELLPIEAIRKKIQANDI